MAYRLEYDYDARTRERRELILKMAVRHRCTNALMLHHPHEEGRKFIHRLKNESRMNITIVERKHISQKQKADYSNAAKVIDHTDVINVLPTDKFDFLDFDFCGALMKRHVDAIEANKYWRVLCLKMSNVFRSNTDTRAIPAGEHVQTWVFDWCKRNDWKCQLNPIPYPRGEKGLWFFSFIITR